MLFGGLKQNGCSIYIDVGIEHRLGDRRSYAGSGSQVYDYFDAVAERFVHGQGVTNVGLDESKVFIFEGCADVSAFDLRVVEVVEIVYADHGPAVVEESLTQMRTNETGGTRYQCFHPGLPQAE